MAAWLGLFLALPSGIAPPVLAARAAEAQDAATADGAAQVGADLAPLAEDLQGARRRLRDLAEDLADAGRAELAAECLEHHATLGAEERERQVLAARVERKLRGADPPRNERAAERQRERLARAAREVAAELTTVAAAEGRAPEHARALARLAVRFDGACAEARRLLGHAQDDEGRWGSPREHRLAAWRRDFTLAAQEARHLDFVIETAEPQDPHLLAVAEDPVAVRHAGILFEGALPEVGLRRMLRDALRGGALSHWMLRGELTPVPAELHNTWVPQGEPYRAYLRAAEAAGMLDPERRALAEQMSSTWGVLGGLGGGTQTIVSTPITQIVVTCFRTDRSFQGDAGYAGWHAMFYGESADAPPWLVAGHYNLIGLGFYGVAWGKYATRSDGDGLTVAEDFESEWLLPTSGVVGARSWLRRLAEERRDPPLSNCLKSEVGLMTGDVLLKSTFAVEYLYARDGAAAVLARYREAFEGGVAEEGPVALLEATLGQPPSDFEEEWRGWMLGGGRALSVVELLGDTQGAEPVGEEAVEVLATLNRRRDAAGLAKVELDPELSEGCRKHAAYLKAHPEMAGEWPEAHQQRMDHEDFTPEGAWAAGHSVIAYGGAERCLDEWLATFYHRLPLTEPWLLAVGFGAEDEICVLDAGSLSNRETLSVTPWPHDGATGVPLRFAPEMPNPVPGESMAGMGYPVTLQIGRARGEPVVTMTLEGPDGPVPCWFTSPHRPLNPELVPRGAWGLIPKQALEPGTTYHARAEYLDEVLAWSFTTGRD